METKSAKYMNPYLAGFLLGLVVLASFYLTGRGLGASGAVKSVVVTTVDVIAPSHAADAKFYSKYVGKETSPMKAWLVFEVLGVLIGGFISGIISDRMGFKVDKGPNTTRNKRLIFAVLGGILFGFGSQLGRGCTSGAALSGMSILSSAGFVTMMAIFGTGYAVAYVFRKLWI